MFANVDWADIGKATIDTLLMLGGSLALTVMLGVPLGVLLYLSGKGRLAANPVLNAVLSFVVNVLRSVPFIILLIVMLPLTVLLVGTSLGVAGAIPPLVVGAAPFYARLVETALREVDKGVVEATQAMGGSTFQIVTRALLPELYGHGGRGGGGRSGRPGHSLRVSALPDRCHGGDRSSAADPRTNSADDRRPSGR